MNSERKNQNSDTPLSTRDVSHLQIMTLFFFAYRAFTSDADKVLKKIEFGRAHHRVLFFVCRKPGMTVAELLNILGITKQSLARVLRQMISKKVIVQQPGSSDRRQRLLFPTPAGRKLILELSDIQSRRISKALKSANIKDPAQISEFLNTMIDPQEQALMDKMAPIGDFS